MAENKGWLRDRLAEHERELTKIRKEHTEVLDIEGDLAPEDRLKGALSVRPED